MMQLCPACSPLPTQHAPHSLRNSPALPQPEISVSGCCFPMLPKVDLVSSFIHVSAQIFPDQKGLFGPKYVILSSLHYCFIVFITICYSSFIDLILLWMVSFDPISMYVSSFRLEAFPAWIVTLSSITRKLMLSSW